MIKSSLCDYRYTHIHVKGAITIPNTGTDADPNNRKRVIFKNCAPFTNCISGINSTQVDNAREIGVVMPMHDLIEYSDIYSKIMAEMKQL